MEELAVLAERAGVALIEDAAQAHGALRKDLPAGSFGLAAGSSFYPGKNLGAYGDGGAVLTNSDDIARKVRALRNYGGERKYEHPEVGFNSRLDTLQAVVLRVKLARLAGWNAARREAADRYHRLLEGLGEVTRPEVCPGNEHVWHLYVVRVPGRDEVLARLHAAGIGAGIHYPIPLHLQGAFDDLGYRKGAFPVAESAAAEILSLPMFPEITPAQQERAVEELARALRR
jgi:dTDP-4-amino-4,6-dideoxygalactose transaminase